MAIQKNTLNIINDAMQPWQRCVKRGVDILFSLMAICLFIPVYLWIIIQLYLDKKGSIFYKQQRIGYLGKPFYIYKFRTMYPQSEKGSPQLMQENDKRIIPHRKYLRDYSLDELPQFWNVLKGDMSLVGPRPEREFFIKQILEKDKRYIQLYKIRPGLTSKAALYNGYTYTIDKMLIRLEMDLQYLQTRTLKGDLAILFKTFLYVFIGKKI